MANLDRAVELQKKIDATIMEYEGIKALAAKEDRLLTDEEKTRCSDLQKLILAMTGERNLEQDEAEMMEKVNKPIRMPVRPEVNSEDELQRKYPGIPPREKRFGSFGEQLRSIVDASMPGGKVDRRLVRSTGMNESNPSDGGFLVQTDFSTELFRRVYEMSPVASRVRTIPISGNSNGLKMNAFAESSRVSSVLGGIVVYWLGEGYAKTPTHPEFRQMELSLKKVAGLYYATDELLQDAAALETIAREGFAEALDVELERVIVRGTGAGQPLGILNSPALISVNRTGATVVAADIINMWAQLYSRSMTSAVWLMSQSVLPYLMSAYVTGTTIPIWLPPNGLAGAPNGTLLGRPIFFIENCSAVGTTGDIILCDLSQYLMITKGGPQFASSIHVQFTYDETCFRIVYRCDGQPMWDTTLTPKDNSNAVSPFVVLSDAQ